MYLTYALGMTAISVLRPIGIDKATREGRDGGGWD